MANCCLTTPICPPPNGGNGGEEQSIPGDCALPLGGPDGHGDNFNGGGSVNGGGGTNSPGPDRPPLPQQLPLNLDYGDDPQTLGVVFPPVVNLGNPPAGEGPTFDYPDPNIRLYDPNYNYEIATESEVLELAQEPALDEFVTDPTSIFKSSINKTLADVVNAAGSETTGAGDTTTPFNGVTLGAILFQTNLVRNALATPVVEELTKINNANTASVGLSNYLEKSIARAIVDGSGANYSVKFLNDITTASLPSFPNGTPQAYGQSFKRNLGYSMLLQHRKSLNPLEYSGATQRDVRLSYIPPRDIDLCFSVITQSGEKTGIRVSNANTIGVIKQDLTTATITEKNEFYPITKQDNSYATVGLPSQRDIAFYIPSNKRGIIDGMFGVGEYSYTITAEADWQVGKDSVELSGGGSAIPEGMLYVLIPSSITEVPSPNSELRTTEVMYKLAWQTNDDESYTDVEFNAVVSGYSGPRTSVYINPKNPFIDVMLTVSGDGERYLKVRFTDTDVPLDGIYPRPIFSDFMIFTADNPYYDPYYGTGSTLDQYEEGLPVKRSIRVINNPFNEIQINGYTSPVISPTRKGIDNKEDAYAFVYNKGFSDGEMIKILSKTTIDNFTSHKSILGTLLTTVSSVDANYDLQDGHLGKQLPQGDLYNLLTLSQIVNFIRDIPDTVISKLWEGTYNNVKIIPIKVGSLEPTYLTSSRLKSGGTDLLDSRVQTVIPQDLSYFNPRYAGILT